MKKYSFLCAIFALLFVGCQSKNEPAQTQIVKFNISTFEQTQQPLKAPAATILDDEGGSALTDIFVFDGNEQVAHQTSDMDAFGTIALPMTHGEHTLHFVATSSKGLTYANDILFASSIRATFGKHLTIDVTSTTEDQDLVLDRLTGKLIITINDAFPANADSIEFIMDKRCMGLRISDFFGTGKEVNTTKASCAAKVGQSGVQYTFNNLVEYLDQEFLTTLTINAYNSSKEVIATVIIPNVRLAANTKTLLSGNLFNLPNANISVNTEWKQNIVITF